MTVVSRNIRLFIDCKDLRAILHYFGPLGSLEIWEYWEVERGIVESIVKNKPLPENWRMVVVNVKEVPDMSQVECIAYDIEDVYEPVFPIDPPLDGPKADCNQIIREQSDHTPDEGPEESSRIVKKVIMMVVDASNAEEAVKALIQFDENLIVLQDWEVSGRLLEDVMNGKELPKDWRFIALKVQEVPDLSVIKHVAIKIDDDFNVCIPIVSSPHAKKCGGKHPPVRRPPALLAGRILF